MGAIADRAKAFIPMTWDGLAGDSRYGTTLLQGRVDRAKFEVLGTDAPPENVENTLDENLKEHITKRAVVKIIPAGIEFWTQQPITVTTTGTSEVSSYESRIAHLRELFKQLQLEIIEEEPLINPPIVKTRGFPEVSDGQNEILITPNPHAFPPLFDLTGGEEEV